MQGDGAAPLSRENYLEIYRRHLADDILAWWLARAPDDARGGVFTCWSNDNQRLASRDKYTWSQGRWAWMMARLSLAARSGLLDLDAEKCLERAQKTCVFLWRRARLPDGSYAYVTDETGGPKEKDAAWGYNTSLFADFFVAIGFAATAMAGGGDEWGARADEILGAGWRRIEAGPVPTEPYPVRAGFQSFALPMILVGAGADIHRATKSAASADCVRWAARRIESLFLDGDDAREYVPDSASDADTLLARHRTPGHVLEACWFMLDAGRTIAAPAEGAFSPARLAAIAARAFSRGEDREKGGLLRYVDRNGGEPRGRLVDDRTEALVASTWDAKLWWPHAEALYALRLLGEAAGRDDLLAAHARLHDYVMRIFPDGPGGEWIQIRDRAGAPLDRIVALPVKDPFHIARALLLLVELLSKPQA